ncbi:aspartic peptidase domain-containing protein [Aspergillus granulosus]|uniref:Aspartic peptidase domain-containing protein n=1 Tax=Aspergillus granulosus TaxID=176169 RepID=A0ABR4H578_9EURO
MLFDIEAVQSTLLYPVSEQEQCTGDCLDSGRFGSFDPARSSSYIPIDDRGEEVWGSESFRYSEGSDILTIGGSQAEGLSFRLVPLVDQWSAVNTLALSWDSGIYYRLVDQGLTISPSFSLWNTPGTGQAGVLFGGINMAKYHGPLHAFSTADTPKVSLPVNGVEIQLQNDTSGSSISYDFPEGPFLIRTSEALTRLPLNPTMQFYTDLGISYDSTYRKIRIPCSRRSENHTLSFRVGNITISAPWGAFISQEFPDRDIDPDIVESCTFDIHPMPEERTDDYAGQLGMNIIQYMYLAADYDTKVVCVAPLNLNPGPDEILEIGPGIRIPDSVGDFPETVTRYTPITTLATTGTSTQAAARTAVPGMAVAGIAGLFFVL